MKSLTVASVVALFCLAGISGAFAQDGYTILHNFGDPAILTGDGYEPYDSLVSNGSTLYGMTRDGGAHGDGTVFSVKADGTGYTILHDFGSIASDGRSPEGNVLLDDSTLYGMTKNGGTKGDGVLFSLKTDGTAYTILHNFDGSVDGENPTSSLIAADGTLYGMTRDGGASDDGVIFSIGKDGTGFTLLHEFDKAVDGEEPYGSLLADGSTLYGMTSGGLYAYGRGTIFSVALDGSGYTTLHQFDGETGAWPYGSLISDGSTLYGMARSGGQAGGFYYYGGGTLFALNPDGTGFTVLHDFGEIQSDGIQPYGDLLLEDGRLFGMTRNGGGSASSKSLGNNLGTIFSIRTDGVNYTQIRSFRGGPNDGARPRGSLISDGSTLYGMTQEGGKYYDNYGGTIFSLPVPTPVPTPTATPVPGLMAAQIWVDKDSYSAGDTQTLSYEVTNPLSPFDIAADAYLALQAPDGRMFFYGPSSMGSGLARFTTEVVPVTTINRVGDVLSGTAAQFLVPPMQEGIWTWYGVLVTKGLKPGIPANRLTNLATDTFEFTK